MACANRRVLRKGETREDPLLFQRASQTLRDRYYLSGPEQEDTALSQIIPFEQSEEAHEAE